MRGHWGERVAKVEVTCLCGEKFRVTEGRIAAGRGRYCSQQCRARYSNIGVKRSHYTKSVVNAGWRKSGETPWNKGHVTSTTYRGIHKWVSANRERPTSCEWCGVPGKTEWANISHEYRREIADWAGLCRRCHGRHDSGASHGAATARFGRRAVQEGV